MDAVVLREFGPAADLRVEAWPDPEPGGGQVVPGEPPDDGEGRPRPGDVVRLGGKRLKIQERDDIGVG